ncbi:hypothetical protein [Pelosinus propionicus]|uniref:Uncharacterized protein n=1 Tax=Pelosinus propionicus DSM 13327 TaxID=1123291 RepID=A0A1I4HNQ8_9FIRM|nr:hypothetical protein [Pelosinus propionicus]SFL43812.1 hypothetical protein SAMN04490355_1004139 [Pelosinus propionicus DSM 13327]
MQRFKKFGWRKNFKKLSEDLVGKLQTIDIKDIVVSAVKNLRTSDIISGKYAHLGIFFDEDTLSVPTFVQPEATNGRYSKYNLEGREIVFKNLPKITRTYSWDAPNYGNSGYHNITMAREVYQRKAYPAKELHIEMEILAGGKITDENSVVKFSVEGGLTRGDTEFNDDLLFHVNLLQENTGVSGIFPAMTPVADYLKTIHVNWELLPQGTREDFIAGILSRVSSPTEAHRSKLQQRYDLLNNLDPVFISGTSGFSRYFGAKFSDNLVVFENLEYGNAIYVMFEDWKVLSRLSRKDLVKGGYNVFRIPHKGAWATTLVNLIKNHR